MKSGISIIEVVISLALASMLSVILFNSFSQSNRTAFIVDEEVDLDTAGAIILRQLEKDFAGATVPMAKQEDMVGNPQQKTGEVEYKPLEKYFFAKNSNKKDFFELLSFTTNNPLSHVVQGQSAVGPKPLLVRVVYRLHEHKEKKGAFVLSRQESTHLDFSFFETKEKTRPREVTIITTVKECSFEFSYTVTHKEKRVVVQKEWPVPPVVGEKEAPLLPAVVKIRLVLWDLRMEADRVFECMVPIYTYVWHAVPRKPVTKTPATSEKKVTAQGQKQPIFAPPTRTQFFDAFDTLKLRGGRNNPRAQKKSSFIDRFIKG